MESYPKKSYFKAIVCDCFLVHLQRHDILDRIKLDDLDPIWRLTSPSVMSSTLFEDIRRPEVRSGDLPRGIWWTCLPLPGSQSCMQ